MPEPSIPTTGTAPNNYSAKRRRRSPPLAHLGDQGYRGAEFHIGIREATGITVQIVQRREGGFRHSWAKAGAPAREVPSFAVVPRRWG